MLFGEIDCREGLLISVQRGHYTDIAEGAGRQARPCLSLLAWPSSPT